LICLFFAVLGIEPRALYMLAKLYY
jgi:hypothetical protein